ncbi:MAG: AfsR/SARP family transcriptional regulator [Actinomycetota bacterium]
MERAPPMKIQLCGHVAIEVGGDRLENRLPGRQGRLLFVYMAAHRIKPLTRDELIEAVWSDEPPPAAHIALRALLSKLRRVLGDSAFEGSDPVRVLLPEAWIDLEAALEAIHRAESAISLQEWARAWSSSQIALFTARRGFLPGEDSRWIDDIRRGIGDLHIRALECYVKASLGVGGTEIPTARRAARELVSLAPFRESAYRLLMEAFVAEGNPAEALRVYERLGNLLSEELGTYPSAETRSLHERILRAAPA